jgi:hypothetical protein
VSSAQVRAELLPLFDVVHSPRNVAIVAHKAIPTTPAVAAKQP